MNSLLLQKESALCNFAFQPESVTDVSSISLTPKPATVGTVHSLSLPGKKDGQKVLMETINIYCCTKESQNLSLRKYLDITICMFSNKSNLLNIKDHLFTCDLCKINIQRTHRRVGVVCVHT